MFGIRGVSHLFKRIDKNGNKQIDVNEFYWGLKEFGVNLTEEEAMGEDQKTAMFRRITQNTEMASS